MFSCRSLQCLETLAQKAGIHDITPDDCKYDVANTLLNLDRGHEFIKQSVDMSDLNKQQMEANAQAQAQAQAAAQAQAQAQVQAQVQQQQMQQVALQQQAQAAAQQQQEQQQAQQALVPAQSPHMQQVTVGASGKYKNCIILSKNMVISYMNIL